MPVLSAYARYLPSGETLALLTRFSDEFEVNLRSVMFRGRNGDRHIAQISPTITSIAKHAMASRRVNQKDWLTCAAGMDSFTPAAEEAPLMGPVKRYPRRARVSINTGASADSPNASRNLLMAAFRL